MDLNTVFTGVIAAATIAYTYFAHKQWKAARAQADIARYVAFASVLQTLANETEKARSADPNSAVLLEAFLGLMTELGFERMAEEFNLAKDQGAREYFARIEGMLRAHGIDPAQVPWMRPIMKQLGKRS
jgi:hypothetical protein